jgi:hypothetical protein
MPPNIVILEYPHHKPVRQEKSRKWKEKGNQETGGRNGGRKG